MSTPNPIIEELHRIREEISRESGDNMKNIAQAVNQRQTKANHELHVIRLPPNRVPRENQPS